jgi:hypothetical protein
MARYEHLPIYKKSLDLAVHFEKTVAGFSRYHKYTLGTEIRTGIPGTPYLIPFNSVEPHLIWSDGVY